MRDMQIRTRRNRERLASTVAGWELERRLFGAHPYGRPTLGSIEDMRRLRRADLASWWNRHGRPDAAVLHVAGDVKDADVFERAAKLFGTWQAKGEGPSAAALPKTDPVATHIVLVDRAGAVQSAIHAGHRAITRADADWPAVQMVNQVLAVRLHEAFRVKKGLAYNLSGGVTARRDAGALGIQAETRTSRTAEAVTEILEVLRALRAKKPDAERIEEARSGLVGSFVRQWETADDVANGLWLIDGFGLSPRFYEEAAAQYLKTTRADVLALARKHLQPRWLTIVVVGDAARLKGPLSEVARVEVVPER